MPLIKRPLAPGTLGALSILYGQLHEKEGFQQSHEEDRTRKVGGGEVGPREVREIREVDEARSQESGSGEGACEKSGRETSGAD
jgi:hypothetical protein